MTGSQRERRRTSPVAHRIRLEAIVFDVGETLVDETRAWSGWADWLGVPRLTFMAALGAALARGETHRQVFELFAPGRDVDVEFRELVAAGGFPLIAPQDLYPDALPCLQSLAAGGYRLGIAANQPAEAADALRAASIDLELMAMSDAWGVSKPDPAFFARIAQELRLPPEAIAYVGDRIDNDVRPAAAAGMVAVFVRRGPWAWINAPRGTPPEAAIVVDSLAELPLRLRRSPFGRRGS